MVEPQRLVLRARPQRSLDQLELLEIGQPSESLGVSGEIFLPPSKNPRLAS